MPSFAETFVKLLPFLVAGAFLPTWTSHVILLLGTDRPIRTSSGFVLGDIVFRLALGFVVLFVADVAAPESASTTIVLPVWLAGMIAGVLFAIGGYLIGRKPKTEMTQSQDQMPTWLRTFRRIGFPLAFVWGFVTVALPGVQWVYFLGGMSVIATSHLSTAEQFIMLVVYVLLLQTMLVTPILIFAWKREKAEALFVRLELWLGRNASTVFGLIIAALGLWFAWIALQGGVIRL